MPRTFSFSTATTSSPTSAESNPASESLVSRIVFAPLLFVSFLVSLLMVDREASSSVFGPSSPSVDNVSSSDKQGKEKKYYHSHQRKLAKREIGDAFERRNKVLVGLCVGTGIALAGSAWIFSRLWEGWGKEHLVSIFRSITSKVR